MASRMIDERTSFVAFARHHVFVTLFGLVLPVVLFACFIGYPIVYTIYLSFFEWNGMAPVKKFVGFANYSYMLGDKYFYISLENNLKWLCGIACISGRSRVSHRLRDACSCGLSSRPCCAPRSSFR